MDEDEKEGREEVCVCVVRWRAVCVWVKWSEWSEWSE